MASPAPVSPLRRLLDERLSQLAADAETLVGEARESARRECADQLNQAVRRIRQVTGPEELAATLADVAAGFATGVALLRVTGDTATLEKVRSTRESTAEGMREAPPRIEVPLVSAPALASAVETRDPVVAAATPSEVSAELVQLLEGEPGDRVSIFPILAQDRVVAVFYAWGLVQGAAMELLAQVAGAGWVEPAAVLPPPVEQSAGQHPAPLVTTIAPAASGWDSLSAAEQRVHLRAQRHARVQVSEMRLFHAEAVQAGRAHGDLYASLRPQIDEARDSFRQKFFANCPSMVDYLHLEILRTLANDDPELLGKDYPGPVL